MSTLSAAEVEALSAEVEHAYKMFDYACRFNEDAHHAYIAWSAARLAHANACKQRRELTA